VKKLASLPLDLKDLNRHSFDVAWMSETGVHRIVTAALVGTVLYVETSEAAVHAIDIATGETRWKTFFRAELDYPPGRTAKHTIVFSSDQVLVLHDGSGRFLWQRRLPYAPAGAPIGRPGRIFYADQAGFVRALCLDTRKPCGDFKTVRRIVGRIAYKGGFVYVGSVDKNVYCLDDALNLMWSFETGGPVESGIFLSGNTVYFGSTDTFMYALDAKTGQPRKGWPFSSGSAIVDMPHVAGGLVFVPSFENGVYGVDAKTGKQRWHAKEGIRFLALGKRYAYLKAAGPNVLAVDPSTGDVKWKWTVGRFQKFISSPTTSDLLLISDEGIVVALREK